MTARPDATLRRWHRDTDGRLHGRTYGHPHFPDGEPIRTTTVVRQYRDRGRLLAHTWDKLYELTGPEGEEWFAQAKSPAGKGSAP